MATSFWNTHKTLLQRDESAAAAKLKEEASEAEKKEKKAARVMVHRKKKVRYVETSEEESEGEETDYSEEEAPRRKAGKRKRKALSQKKPMRQQQVIRRSSGPAASSSSTKVRRGEDEVDYVLLGKEMHGVGAHNLQEIYPKFGKKYKRAFRNGLKCMLTGSFNKHLTKPERESLKKNRTEVMELVGDENLACNPFDEKKKEVAHTFLNFMNDMNVRERDEDVDGHIKTDEADKHGINWNDV